MDNFFDNLSFLFLQPTKKCNISCDFCYARNIDQSQEGDWVERFINEFEFNTHQINFHGGEPLLVGWKKLEEMFSTIRKKHSGILKIQTNFFLMDENIVQLTKDYNIHIGTSFNPVGRIHPWDKLDRYATKMKYPLSAVTILNRDMTTNYIDKLMLEIFPKYQICQYNFEMYKPISPEDYSQEDINYVRDLHKYIFDKYINIIESNKYIFKPFTSRLWDCAYMACIERGRSIAPNGEVFLCNFSGGVTYAKPIADISKGIIYHDEIERLKSIRHKGCAYRAFGEDNYDTCRDIYYEIYKWQQGEI